MHDVFSARQGVEDDDEEGVVFEGDEEDEGGSKGGDLLRQMDMLAKAALDPRLLRDDVEKVTRILDDEVGVVERWKKWDL